MLWYSNGYSVRYSNYFNSPKKLSKLSREPRIKKEKSDKRIYIIDIDGTICTKTKSDYISCEPITENIDIFNRLFEQGHEVHYWTARGALSGKKWDELTIKQLDSWNVKYNSINMGKPHYDVWIDDKAINSRVFCDY
tara:strand:- start:3550 stop:3960 length:411 start_codon:yes stop_codon:yes gene_type:complete